MEWHKRGSRFGIVLGSLLLGGCTLAGCRDRTASTESIGEATMESDGTIVLLLRAEGPAGERGDALLRYSPSHREYQDVLKHLGGLKPGEKKPVPPWPEK